MPLYIKHYMQVNDDFVATIVGVIIFGAGLFSALASISIGRITKWMSMPNILLTATCGVGGFFILQYLMPNVWGLGIFRTIAGFLYGFYYAYSEYFDFKGCSQRAAKYCLLVLYLV